MGDDLLQQSSLTPARVVLVTGGCRSGKSSFAQRYAEERMSRRVYLATCPVFDGEMAERVRRHRSEREGKGWETVEEELELARALAAAPAEATVLVDCLTLWANNLLHRAESSGRFPDEEEAVVRARELAAVCRSRSATTVMVTNEVGLGIVPANPLARRFRDVAGRINQVVAAAADEVYLLVCGLPTRIK